MLNRRCINGRSVIVLPCDRVLDRAKYCLDRDILRTHSELIVLDIYTAASDIPRLQLISCSRSSSQSDFVSVICMMKTCRNSPVSFIIRCYADGVILKFEVDLNSNVIVRHGKGHIRICRSQLIGSRIPYFDFIELVVIIIQRIINCKGFACRSRRCSS